MVLVTSVLNGTVLRANMKVVVQESRVNGRVLEAILEAIIHEGRPKGKILEGGRRLLRAVSMGIERSLLDCALDKLCKGSWLVELIQKLIEVGHLVNVTKKAGRACCAGGQS